jgi:hypothetical protein
MSTNLRAGTVISPAEFPTSTDVINSTYVGAGDGGRPSGSISVANRQRLPFHHPHDLADGLQERFSLDAEFHDHIPLADYFYFLFKEHQ